MQKAGVKAFIYSFSVSLLAINVAGKALLSSPLPEDVNLNVAGKSIALFVKKTQTSRNPSKKIYLSSLPEIELAGDKSSPEPEIILASLDVEPDIPLDFSSGVSDVEQKEDVKKTSPIIAEIVYSEEKPLPEVKIEAKPVYKPEDIVVADIASPPIVPLDIQREDEVVFAENKNVDDGVVRVPLQQGKTTLLADRIVKIGDPARMNHVALDSESVPIESMKKDEVSAENTERKEDVKETWAQAESAGGKNQMASKVQSDDVKEGLSSGKEKASSDTVRNLIIPIPENVANTEILTPRLAYPEGDEDSKKESVLAALNQKLLKAVGGDKDDVLALSDGKKEGGQGIVNSLTSLFKGGKDNKRELAISKAKARMSADSVEKDQDPSLIVPKEIRLSFQPNRAEISGQTLKWIQAFALKAAKEVDAVLEIRMDGTSSMVVQQKRLNMLYNILLNKGVEYSKISTVFTAREPNSFVLRMLQRNDNGRFGGKQNMKIRNKRSSQGGYIQW